jgi:O-antigen ligase
MWPAVLIGSLFLGLVASRGIGLLTLSVLAAACAAVLVLLMQDHLRLALLAWIPLGVLAFPWVRIPRGQAVITFDRAWIGAVVLTALLTRRPRNRTSRSQVVAFALGCLVLAFAIRIAVTVTTVGDAFSARTAWVDAVLLPTGLFVVTRRLVTDAAAYRQFASVFTVAGAMLALLGIAQHLWGFELASLSGGLPRYDASVGLVRISGPYTTPEVFGLNLTICFAATLYWLQARRGISCMIGGVIAALEVVAVGLTLFRAAWIACALVIIATVTARSAKGSRTVGIATVVSMLLIGLHLSGSVGVISERLSNSSNVYGRFATYQQGLAIFRTKPLMGIGVNQFTVGQELVAEVTVSGIRAVETAHSTFVSILAEQGLLGFVPLMLLTVAIWRLLRGLHARVTTPEDLLAVGAFRGATLAYLVMSLTLTMWPYGSSNAFFLMVLGAAAGRADALAAEEQNT